MDAVLNVALPVFAIMATGWLSGHFGLLGPQGSETLNRFVYYAALPALFLVSMAKAPIADIFNWNFIGAFFGAQIATFAIAVTVGKFLFPGRLAEMTLQGLSGMFSNTGYMGIPLLILAYPLVLSASAGLAWSATGLPLPVPIENFCSTIGAAASPTALFAIGLFMVGRQVTAGLAEVSWLVFLKLIVNPAIALLLILLFFPMEPIWVASAVIMSALPTGGLVFILAQKYDIYLQRSTSAILISTVLSLLTLSAVMIYYLPG
jgi:predicted permease